VTRGSEALALTVNGTAVTVEVHPLTPLAHVLRDELGLTGTKLGCGGGDCGSCTVLLEDGDGDRRPVASCLLPVVRAAGCSVTTIEGLAGLAAAAGLVDVEALHPVQESFRRNNASQCGYCIPGLVMASVELVEGDEPLGRDEVRRLLAGNLCRCTGYESIVDAICEAQQTRLQSPRPRPGARPRPDGPGGVSPNPPMADTPAQVSSEVSA